MWWLLVVVGWLWVRVLYLYLGQIVLEAVRQEQLSCFDDVWSDDGTEGMGRRERWEGGHL